MLSGHIRIFWRHPGTTLALDGLELEVPEGSIVAVLGASGSGKTTLLRLIAGFERPGTGTVEIRGEVVDSARSYVPPDKRRVGYVTQEGNLFPHLSVARNVAFGLRRAERAAGTVNDLLDLVGLAGFGKRYAHQLSGGRQQRVALVRALARQPKALLLDEPFSSLDAGGRAALRHDVMGILRS
ncbi:MAG: ABC transporter ATP-binding protein [Acidimicrobiales bacterium]